jgi:hypothetical protein
MAHLSVRQPALHAVMGGSHPFLISNAPTKKPLAGLFYVCKTDI